MGDFLGATWLLFRMHLFRLARSKRALVCAVIAAVPPTFAWLVWQVEKAPTLELLAAVSYWMHIQVAVPLVALIAGSAVVNEEVENRTITYLFTRPMPRAALFIGRWAATLVVISVLLAAGAFMVLKGASVRAGSFEEVGMPPEFVEQYYTAVLLGGATYSVLFAMLGIFLRHPMIVGLGYTFAIEGLIANLPVGTQSLSIQYYLRTLMVDMKLDVWREIIPPTALLMEAEENAGMTLVLVLIAALAIGSFSIARRQFVLTS